MANALTILFAASLTYGAFLVHPIAGIALAIYFFTL